MRQRVDAIVGGNRAAAAEQPDRENVVTDGVRVETEDLADGLERVRPAGLLGAEPLGDLVEAPSAAMIGSEATFVHAMDRILDDAIMRRCSGANRPLRVSTCCDGKRTFGCSMAMGTPER